MCRGSPRRIARQINRESVSGEDGREGGGGGSNAEPVNFSASNDFPAVEVLAELANASRLSNLSLSISV